MISVDVENLAQGNEVHKLEASKRWNRATMKGGYGVYANPRTRGAMKSKPNERRAQQRTMLRGMEIVKPYLRCHRIVSV